MTLYVSWSSLRTHESCKEQGFHARQGRRASIQDSRGFFPGTVTDRVVRDALNNGDDYKPGSMKEMVESVIDREWAIIKDEGGSIAWKNPGDRDQVIKDCIEAVTKIEPYLLKYVFPFEYQPDFGFRAPLEVPHPDGGTETIILRGFMDILVRDNKGRWMVHDVKHTRDNQYWRKTEGQLTFYDLAVFLLFGQGTLRTSLLQPLCNERMKPFLITEEKRAQMIQRIAGMARDIWNDEHPPRTDSVECHFCPVKHACSKFQPVVDAKGKRRVSFGGL